MGGGKGSAQCGAQKEIEGRKIHDKSPRGCHRKAGGKRTREKETPRHHRQDEEGKGRAAKKRKGRERHDKSPRGQHHQAGGKRSREKETPRHHRQDKEGKRSREKE